MQGKINRLCFPLSEKLRRFFFLTKNCTGTRGGHVEEASIYRSEDPTGGRVAENMAEKIHLIGVLNTAVWCFVFFIYNLFLIK